MNIDRGPGTMARLRRFAACRVCLNGHGFFREALILLVAFACTSTAVFAGELQPRRELPKCKVVSQPDYPHRLVVKFRDALRVRSSPDGLMSLVGGDLSVVAAVLTKHEATASPLIHLPAATLGLLERRASRSSGIAQPDLAGIMVLDAPKSRREQLANELNALDAIEFVYFQQLNFRPTCEDIPPQTRDYFDFQSYHGPDPGLNMTAAWEMGSASGAGVNVALVERAYYADHEDLCDIVLEPGQTMMLIPRITDPDHGTAGFGELISLDNDYGCTGLVPDATGYFFPSMSLEEGSRLFTAITSALLTLGPGDVVLLNIGPFNGPLNGPLELDRTAWMLIRIGSDLGIVMVEPAGNGNLDLDTQPDLGDSGAIIVGAGSPDIHHDKLRVSNFGSRVNLQAWGSDVFTLGYGDFAQPGGDVNQSYTDNFSGTSAAAPMIAACAVALQSLANEHLGQPLTPLELRDILIRTGIPQGSGGHIGPFPDMAAAAAEVIGPLGDLDGDGVVGILDLLILLSAWGPCLDPPARCPADLDDDGGVGILDLLTLLAHWG